MFYSSDSAGLAQVLRVIFYFFPPHSFTLLYGIISRTTSYHFDDSSLNYIEGRNFHWKDLTISEAGEFSNGAKYISPTPLSLFGIISAVTVFYLFWMWYLDHIISANRGTNESFLFFCKKSYWKTWGPCSCKKVKAEEK